MKVLLDTSVTKLLNGNSNFTLKTLLKVADALDLKFNVSFSTAKPINNPVLVHPFTDNMIKGREDRSYHPIAGRNPLHS